MKRGRQLGIALVLLLTAAIMALCLRLPPTHDLIRLEKPVPGTAYRQVSDYFWNNDPHLLTVTEGTTRTFFQINTVTGKSLSLPGLNNTVGSDDYLLCSPNGQWIMSDKKVQWGKYYAEGGQEYGADVIHVVKADGSRSITQKIYAPFYLRGLSWLNNHQYVLYIETIIRSVQIPASPRLAAQIHDTEGAELTQKIPINLQAQALVESHIGDHLSDGGQRWLTTPNQHLFLVTANDLGFQQQATVCDIDLHHNPTGVQQKTFLLPKDGMSPDPYSIIPSPDGKRIAWNLHFNDRYVRSPSFWEQLWNVHIRHMAPLLPVTIPTEEVWVSNIDGSGMHQIAYQEDTGESSNIMIVNLQWVSDGRSLSFMRNAGGLPGAGDPIYTIPAD